MNVRDVAQGRPAPAAVRLADQEPRAFEHEHAELYKALEHAAQRAELAGHDDLARLLRIDRRRVARELHDGRCELPAPEEHR